MQVWFVIMTAIYRDVLVFILKYLSKYNFFKKNIDNFQTNYTKKKRWNWYKKDVFII